MRLLKTFCNRLARKIALVIYGARMVGIPPNGVKRFATRLFRSARNATTEQQANDAMEREQAAILGEYNFYSRRMWKFSGSCVARLFVQLGVQHDWVTFDDFPFLGLQRRLFHLLRKAGDDADVNARVDSFFADMYREYN